MNKSTRYSLFAGVLFVCTCGVGLAQTTDDFVQPFDAARIADNIIVGLLSEEQFQQMNLAAAERLEVFKTIKQQRGWTMSDEDLQAALELADHGRESPPLGNETAKALSVKANAPNAVGQSNAITGSCNQYIRMEEGYSYAQYPLGFAKPSPGECGSDKDDIIIGYRTPNYPRTNTNNVHSWSPHWWVRLGMRVAYTDGGMAANGLCSTVTRACVGTKGRALVGPDLQYIYLWQKP